MLKADRKSWDHGDVVETVVTKMYRAVVCHDCGYPNGLMDDYCDNCESGNVVEEDVEDIEERHEDGYVGERVRTNGDRPF